MTDLQIIDCEQNSPEWYQARCGIPTASEYATVMASGRGNQPSKSRRTYLYKVAGEILTGEPADNYSNAHMERGHIMEPDAVSLYEMVKDVETQTIGFMRRGRTGCSPDRLIGNDGLLEVKTKLPHLQIDVLLSNEVPTEHMAQIQGALWISGREWCDFVSYWPRLPLFVKRVYRHKLYIEEIAKEVQRFNNEVDELLAKLHQEAA